MSNLLSEISTVVPTPSSAVSQLPPSAHSSSSDPLIARHYRLFDAFDRAFGKHPTLASPLNSITTPVYLATLIERYAKGPTGTAVIPTDAAFDLVNSVGPAGTLGELLQKIDQLHGLEPSNLF